MEAGEASCLLAEQKETTNPVEPSEKCKVYGSRWYVLFVFTLMSIVSNLMWNTWGPIQRPCTVVFKWDRWTILLLSSLGASGPIFGAFPSTWMMDTKGLRISALVTSIMLLVGKALQLIPFNGLVSRTVFIYIGHLITMLPSFVPNGAPPLVSSTWFPPNERTTATAIATLAANFGIALSFIIGPQMISVDKVGNLTDADAVDGSNRTKRIDEIEGDIMNYLYVQTGITALLVLCILVYLPDKPPLPPSVAALTRASTKISYLEGSKMLLNNKSYWLLATVFALSFGIYFAWTSVLDIAVQPFGIGETFSGWLGTGTSLAGIISGIFIARSADIMKHWTKTILVSLYIGTVLWQLLFAFSCSRILPFSKALLLVSVTGIGLLFNGTIPLLFELIMEHVFPVGEGTSVGIALILGNAVMLLFDVTFMFPMSDVRWMNWVFVGGIGLCIPLLLLYKTQYRRLDLDTD